MYCSNHTTGGGPGIGNVSANSSTLLRTASILVCHSAKANASLYCFKVVFSRDADTSMESSMASMMKSTTFSISFSKKLRDVRAGVPIRIPLGRRALLSPGTVLRFTEIKNYKSFEKFSFAYIRNIVVTNFLIIFQHT